MKYYRQSVVLISMLTLSACNSPHGPIAHRYTSENNKPESYALKQDKAYNNLHKNQFAEVINSLKAPADQTYYFSFNSQTINPKDYPAITVQANYLATHPGVKVRIEGNTDSRGSREYNVGLGWRRGQAVVKLLEQKGVLSRQIDQVSYGKERPAVLGNNDAAWRLNRRVNLVYEAG